MRILVVQETDWIDRNPILHHRMLEALSIAGDDITVLDYEILWGRHGVLPLWQRRRVWRDASKLLPGSRIVVVRPGMLRIPGIARVSWLVATWFELLRYLRAGTPDVIVAYGISNAFLAALLARRRRIPFVFHLFDALHAIAEPPALRRIAAVVEGAVLRMADRVVITYRPLRRYVERMGVRPDAVVFIPSGFSRREADPAARATTRAHLGIRDDEVVLLFIGWLYRHSGLAEIARELARDPVGYAKFRLVIVGDGDLSATLHEIKATHGLGNRLILTGRRPAAEMPAFIAAADLCLLTSTPDRAMRYIVPSKVDAYLELGKPVVSTRLEGMVAELRDVGGIVWVDSPRDALPQIERLLSGPEAPADVLARLSRESATYSASRETWEAVTERFRAVLAQAAAR